MVRMIPAQPREGANRSERQVFMALEGIQDRDDWVVIHSLAIGRNLAGLTGEADFLVLVPGRGILVIETKSPQSVEYRAGEWYLDRTPSPRKDPLKQLEAARRSIRGFLRERDLLRGGEPIARLVWFTSIARHAFANRTPGDLQFFEWELGWQDDLAKPAWLVEKVLDEHIAWFGEVDAVDLDPAAFDAEHAEAVAGALLADFTAHQSKGDRRRERAEHELRLLAEQRFALELVEDNEHVYFEGPAGTGKSYLLVSAAKRLGAEGARTLVTCWNVLMAEQLQRYVGRALAVETAGLADLMLRICGLPTSPPGAGDEWFRSELPRLTLAALAEKPYLGGYEALVVDEFQDIAASPLLVDVLFALAGTGSAAGTRVIAAGDSGQQILGPAAARVDPYAVLRERIPDLVRVGVRRNCRMAPAVVASAETVLGRSMGFTAHRMPRSTEASFDVEPVGGAGAEGALATALKRLLEQHEPEEIVILSPFGAKRSLIGRFLDRQERSADERWLRKQLQHEGSAGRIRWRSIFKFKGLDAEAVVLTDLGDDAKAFAAAEGLSWEDLLYVGLTRAKYRCVVVG